MSILFQILISLIDSGINSQNNVLKNEPCLLLPGVHELMMAIGEGFCVVIEINHQFVFDNDLTNLTHLIKILIDKKIEYCIHIIQGASGFLKKKSPISEKKILEPIFELMKKKCFESVIDYKTINNFLDLKSVLYFF
jgi:hypothetical protein